MAVMQLQISALLIVIMLFYIVLSRKMLKFFTDKIFLLMLVLIFADIVFDMVSTYMTISFSSYSSSLYQVLAKCYLSLMLLSVCCVFLYIIVDASGNKRKAYRILPIAILPGYFGVGYIAILPVSIRIAENGIFYGGRAAWVAYGISIFYLCMVMVVLGSRKGKMKRETREAARMIVIIFIVMIIVEKLNSNLRVESLALALMAVFVYMNLKNADEHFDKIYGVFNQDAFEYYMRDIVEDGRQAYVLYIGFDDFKGIAATFGFENARALFGKIVNALLMLGEGEVFRLDANELACVFKGNAGAYRNYRSAVLYKLREDYMILDANVKLPVYLVEVPIPSTCYDYGEVHDIMKQCMTQMVSSGQTYMLVKEADFEELRRQNYIRHVIERAIDMGKVDMWYQPIYNMQTETFDSAEALIRMYDEEGKEIPSATVIRIADKTGLMLKLGNLIFESVFSFAQEKQLLGTRMKKLHINLSGVQCAHEDLVSNLLEKMSSYEIAPAYIDLEIREHAEQLSDTVLRENMQTLISYGSSFSIDDYGKGYANLEAIMEWPIECVKLDRELVHMEEENLKAEQAVHFVLQIAKQLGLKVVAKGVESEEDFIRMKALGVDYIQGFYLARVLKPADFLDFLEKPLIMKSL